MTIEFKFPDVGEGVAEGEIVQWLVAAGDTVEEHQSVVEVMTDKATVEIPAPADGVVTKLLAEPGETVPVGQVIFHLDSASGDAPVEEAAPDLLVATHWHEDHLDPEGLPILARRSHTRFLGTPSCRSRLLGWLGGHQNRRLPVESFRRAVYAILVLLGLLLLFGVSG